MCSTCGTNHSKFVYNFNFRLILKYNLTIAYFYTFTTIEGDTVSITGTHFIIVVHSNEQKMKIIPALKVTLKHQLIMAGRRIGLKQIVYSERIGFYSPITLSGYLAVNNLSTSVYVDV